MDHSHTRRPAVPSTDLFLPPIDAICRSPRSVLLEQIPYQDRLLLRLDLRVPANHTTTWLIIIHSRFDVA